MYGKIFDSMYEGTLYGQWEALVTFQQMIVLCDADGIIDMTPPAISARTSIPLEIISKGITILEKPDPYSRTPEQEGRRIELIDAHRPWGWHIINHEKYQHMQDADTIRAQTRERVRRHREAKEKERNGNVDVTDSNGQKRHTDTDTDTDTDTVEALGKAEAPALRLVGDSPKRPPDCPHQRVIDLYHEVLPTCPHIRDWTPKRQKLLQARWREKASPAGKHRGYATAEEGLAYWRRFFGWVAESQFLTGGAPGTDGRAPFIANLVWLLDQEHFANVIEGKYHHNAA